MAQAVCIRAMAGAGFQQALRLVGRAAECAADDRLLEDARGCERALVVRGEPGMSSQRC